MAAPLVLPQKVGNMDLDRGLDSHITADSACLVSARANFLRRLAVTADANCRWLIDRDVLGPRCEVDTVAAAAKAHEWPEASARLKTLSICLQGMNTGQARLQDVDRTRTRFGHNFQLQDMTRYTGPDYRFLRRFDPLEACAVFHRRLDSWTSRRRDSGAYLPPPSLKKYLSLLLSDAAILREAAVAVKQSLADATLCSRQTYSCPCPIHSALRDVRERNKAIMAAGVVSIGRRKVEVTRCRHRGYQPTACATDKYRGLPAGQVARLCMPCAHRALVSGAHSTGQWAARLSRSMNRIGSAGHDIVPGEAVASRVSWMVTVLAAPLRSFIPAQVKYDGGYPIYFSDDCHRLPQVASRDDRQRWLESVDLPEPRPSSKQIPLSYFWDGLSHIPGYGAVLRYHPDDTWPVYLPQEVF